MSSLFYLIDFTLFIKSLALLGSTAFHVFPSSFNEEPIITPSATLRISSTFSILTPVLASTGVSGIKFLTFFNSLIATDSPVIWPETKIASGIDEKTTLLDLSATERLSRE